MLPSAKPAFMPEVCALEAMAIGPWLLAGLTRKMEAGPTNGTGEGVSMPDL
jgi:hypothetical protein